MFPTTLSTSSAPNNGSYTTLFSTTSSITLMTSRNRLSASTLTAKVGRANLMLLRCFLRIYAGLPLHTASQTPTPSWYAPLPPPPPYCYRRPSAVADDQHLGAPKPPSGAKVPRCRRKVYDQALPFSQHRFPPPSNVPLFQQQGLWQY